jgi:acyl carrier protein
MKTENSAFFQLGMKSYERRCRRFKLHHIKHNDEWKSNGHPMIIELQIRELLNQVLLFDETDGLRYSNNESFLKNNWIDSTTIMEIVLLVEATFGIEIQDNEIIPDNFDSIAKIAHYIRLKFAHELPEEFVSFSDEQEYK